MCNLEIKNTSEKVFSQHLLSRRSSTLISFECVRQLLALERDLPKIDLDLLRESFEENLAINAPGLENPFKQ